MSGSLIRERNSGGCFHRGFTLIELLIVLTILAILAAILLPVFARAREKARQVVCFSNQRQIGMAMLLYSQDYDEALVPNHTGARVVIRGIDQWHAWYDLIQPYIKDPNHWVFQCPSNPQSRPVGGGFFLSYNKRGCFENLLPGEDSSRLWWGYMAQVLEPAETISVADWGGGSTEGPGGTRNEHRLCPHWHIGAQWVGLVHPVVHSDGANYIFVDGHVKWMKYAQTIVPRNLWNVTRKDTFHAVQIPPWPWP